MALAISSLGGRSLIAKVVREQGRLSRALPTPDTATAGGGSTTTAEEKTISGKIARQSQNGPTGLAIGGPAVGKQAAPATLQAVDVLVLTRHSHKDVNFAIVQTAVYGRPKPICRFADFAASVPPTKSTTSKGISFYPLIFYLRQPSLWHTGLCQLPPSNVIRSVINVLIY